MPTLAGFGGESLVPNLTGAFRQGGEAFTGVQNLVKDRMAADEAKRVRDMEQRGLLAYQFLQQPDIEKQNTMLLEVAKGWANEGRDLKPLMDIYNLGPNERNTYAQNVLNEYLASQKLIGDAMGVGSGGRRAFGNKNYVKSDKEGFVNPVTWFDDGTYQIEKDVYEPERINMLNTGKEFVGVGQYGSKPQEVAPVPISESPDTTARLDPNRAAAVAEATSEAEVTGRTRAENAAGAPTAAFNARAMIDQLKENQSVVRKAMKQAKGTTTGLVGSFLKYIPGTGAFDLETTLSTINSNLGLTALTNLKQSGATLGAVSEKELELLLSKVANLRQAQSEQQFKSQLNDVLRSYDRTITNIQNELRVKYKDQFAAPPKQGQPAAKPSRVSPAAAGMWGGK
jgi:hypothetical protein